MIQNDAKQNAENRTDNAKLNDWLKWHKECQSSKRSKMTWTSQND